jgi:20S proteasome subunit beta 3
MSAFFFSLRAFCALIFAVVLAAGDRSFHGGTLLAMAGRDCVVIASDSRFSSYQTGSFMLGQFPRSIYRIGSKTIVGFYGLDSDARTVVERLREKLLDHEDAHVQPSHLARVLSDTLYATGLLTSPIVVGMENDGQPFICSMDGLGAQTVTDSFAVAGTANTGLYAMCESAYRPGLSAEELVDVVERCMRMALQVRVSSNIPPSRGVLSFTLPFCELAARHHERVQHPPVHDAAQRGDVLERGARQRRLAPHCAAGALPWIG